MDERRHPLAECEKCPLAKERNTAFVPSVLPEGATLAFVGEAPGRNEVQKREPFIGASGNLMNILMERNGIQRSDVILTNAVACNKPTGDITPSPVAIRACRPRLVAELEKAETVVPMGNSAAQAVFGSQVKITQVRIGPSKQGSDIFPDKRIIPTIHPAACLRFSDHFPYLLMDFAKINQTDEVRWEPPKYKVWDTPEEVRLGLQALTTACPIGAPIAVDIETGVEKDDDYSHPSQILTVGLSWADKKAVVIEREALKSDSVRRVLARFLAARKLIAHNGKYDFQVLNNVWDLWGTNNELNTWFDTMLASYALDERPGTNSLDYNGQEVLGTPNWKGVIGRYIGRGDSYAKVPVDVLDEYNAYDVSVTWLLYKLFDKELKSAEGLYELHNMMVRFANHLAFAEMQGVQVDLKYNQELFDKYSEILDPLELSLKPWVDNPRSPKQVKEALAPLLGIKVEKIESTDAEHLEKFQEMGIMRKQEDLA